jgi:hypothetical protein
MAEEAQSGWANTLSSAAEENPSTLIEEASPSVTAGTHFWTDIDNTRTYAYLVALRTRA